MIIIADSRLPQLATQNLAAHGELIPFITSEITYPAISGHPDIFMVQTEKGLIVAPNLPDVFKNIFTEKRIAFEEGNAPVGSKYPQTAAYNAVITNDYFIHNLQFTDARLLATHNHLEKIHVRQAYTRCNLMALNEEHFITSDHGIEKTLDKLGLSVLFVDPSDILLPGMKHGFFGGCCGIYGNTVFIIGNLDFIQDGKNARDFISTAGFELVELYDGPLFDGGGLFIIDE